MSDIDTTQSPSSVFQNIHGETKKMGILFFEL